MASFNALALALVAALAVGAVAGAMVATSLCPSGALQAEAAAAAEDARRLAAEAEDRLRAGRARLRDLMDPPWRDAIGRDAP